jgi:hypothetical protein
MLFDANKLEKPLIKLILIDIEHLLLSLELQREGKKKKYKYKYNSQR